VGHTEDVFDALDHQEDLQTRYTGGTVFHAFLGEAIESWEACRSLVKAIASNYRIPYFTISPVFSICPVHGYLSGEHYDCPKCREAERARIIEKIKSLEIEREAIASS
jgi:ribonucleoside-triphosphate reductase